MMSTIDFDKILEYAVGLKRPLAKGSMLAKSKHQSIICLVWAALLRCRAMMAVVHTAHFGCRQFASREEKWDAT